MSRKRHDNYNLNLEVEAALPVACGRPSMVGHYSYMNKFSVQVRICRPGIRVDAIRSYFETWFVPDGEDLVFRSPITAQCHLAKLHPF